MDRVGDRVFVLSGLDVQEWEVYRISEAPPYKGPWIRRDSGVGMAASHYLNQVYATVDAAIAASNIERERQIKRCARELQKLALSTNVKVVLMKAKSQRGNS